MTYKPENVKQIENPRMAWVSPETLNPNDWNTNYVSPENEAKLEESLDRFGVFKPIVVRELDDGSFQILGGEHRALAAQRKGMEKVPIVNLGKIDDKTAKEISLVDNGRYGADDTIALAELLESLGGDSEELANFLPYTDTELSTIFSSTNIDFDELDFEPEEEVAAEEPPKPEAPAVQTHQVIRFKVPVEDAHKVTELIERVMKEQNFTGADSLTNAGDALVHVITKMVDA